MTSPVFTVRPHRVWIGLFILSLLGASGCTFVGVGVAAILLSDGGGSGSGNAEPVVQILAVPRGDEEVQPVRVLLADREGDETGLRLEYSVGGGPFQPATVRAVLRSNGTPILTGAGQSEDPLPTSSGGVPYTLEWSWPEDLGPEALTAIDLRLVPLGKVGQPRGVAFTLNGQTVGNNPSQVSDVEVIGTTGRVVVRFQLEDSTGDLARVAATFSTEGGAFLPITQVVGGATENLVTTAEGSFFDFTWDTTAEPDLQAAVKEVVVALLPTDETDAAGIEALAPVVVIDNNTPPRATNLFDLVDDARGALIVPFILEDEDTDPVETLIQWKFVTQEDFPQLPPNLEDPAQRAAILDNPVLRSQLQIITEEVVEFRGVVGAESTEGSVRMPEVLSQVPMSQVVGATLITRSGVTEVEGTVSGVQGGDLLLDPALAAPPTIGAAALLRLPTLQGRPLPTTPEGLTHRAIWSTGQDVLGFGAVQLRVLPFDARAGTPGVSLLSDRVIEGLLREAPNSPLETGNRPQMLLLHDVNGDELLDVFVPNEASEDLSVYLQDEDDGLDELEASPLEVGEAPVSVAAGDLNDDGFDDLAVANEDADTVTIYLQDEFGDFAMVAEELEVDAIPSSVQIADFNHDGLMDLSVAHEGSSLVLVFYQDMTTHELIQGPSSFFVDAEPATSAVGDLNGDGWDDLAVAGSELPRVAIIFQGASGLEGPPVFLPVEDGPEFTLVADVNGDELDDLLVVNAESGSVTLFLQDEDGLAEPDHSPLQGGEEPNTVAAGDLDGDDRVDLAISNSDSEDLIILLQQPDGTFEPAPGSPFPVSRLPESVNIGDLNGDEVNDLAMIDEDADHVRVFLLVAEGELTTAPGSPFPAGAEPSAIAVGDLNGDGRADVAVANEEAGTVSRYLQDFQGNLDKVAGPALEVGEEPSAVVLGDLNGDHLADLAVASLAEGEVWVFFQEEGALAEEPTVLAIGGVPTSLAIGDVSGDGLLDLLVTEADAGELFVFRQDEDDGFEPPTVLSVGNLPLSVAVGDVDSDGRMDVVVATADDDAITVFFQTSGGALVEEDGVVIGVGAFPMDVAVADVNGDERADILVVNTDDMTLTVLLQTDTGFSADPDYPAGDAPVAVAADDLNGDGRLDVAVVDEESSEVIVFFQQEDGTLEEAPGSPYLADEDPVAIALGDLNGDGGIDMAIAGVESDNFTVYVQD